MAKLVPQLIHTSYGAEFHPHCYNTYKMNITASQVVGVLFSNFYYDLIHTCGVSIVVKVKVGKVFPSTGLGGP
jgi:hypothetical protein